MTDCLYCNACNVCGKFDGMLAAAPTLDKRSCLVCGFEIEDRDAQNCPSCSAPLPPALVAEPGQVSGAQSNV